MGQNHTSHSAHPSGRMTATYNPHMDLLFVRYNNYHRGFWKHQHQAESSCVSFLLPAKFNVRLLDSERELWMIVSINNVCQVKWQTDIDDARINSPNHMQLSTICSPGSGVLAVCGDPRGRVLKPISLSFNPWDNHYLAR